MKLSWRILLLVLFTTTLSGLGNYFLTQYQGQSLHNNSEKILADTIFQSLRDTLVQDVIDGNKLRVTNVLKKLHNHENPIEYLYITNGGPRHIFAHSFEKGFPRYLLDDNKSHLEKHLAQTGIELTKKILTDRGIIYVYAEPLLQGLEAILHVGINQSEIKEQLAKNSQAILITSMAISLLALIIAYLWSKKITEPLVSFTQQLKRFGEGKATDFNRVKTSTPEIRQLASTFQQAASDREQAIKALQEREQNLTITLNSIGDAVITTDTVGRVTRMNPIAEKLTGWSFKEADGVSLKTIFPIIDASTRKPIENPVDKVVASGETIYLSNHTTLIAKDGKEYQIADSAAPICNHHQKILGMVLVFNDVTEQYQLRETAAKSKRDMQAIMDNSPSVIYAKDIEGRYVFVNQEWESLFDKNKEGLTGKTDYEIFPKEFADSLTRNDKAILNTGHALKIEETAPHDNGARTYVSAKFPLYDENDNIYAVCGISTDITDYKQQEEQLRRSQKMDALGKLTGGIAHDYNNMLGVILGYSELLKSRLADQPKLADYTNKIHHAGERGAKLTKKLLSFSRKVSHEAAKLDINSLLQEQRDMLQKTLTVRIKLVLDLADNVWPIWLDESDLEDTVLNMSINAMHAMVNKETGAQLTIRTCNQSLNTTDALSLGLTEGDYVQLSLADTGSGMDKEVIDKIFDPFYSTKGDEGTGLGLSQVFGFVKRSGGTIKVYSEPGQGSQFILYFPRYLDDVGKNTTETSEDNFIFTGHENILIVDDEEALGSLTSELLSQQGYQTFYAESSKQALKILEHKDIDLILSDIIMPEMDGYQLAAIVKEKYPDIKIQLTSGFSDNHNIDMVDKSLQHNLLLKPFDSQVLLQRIKTLLSVEP